MEGARPKSAHANRCNWSKARLSAVKMAGLVVRCRPWREWQPHVEGLMLRCKHKVWQVRLPLSWEISNSFWGFSPPRLLCFSLALPPTSVSPILCLTLGFALNFPSTACLSLCVCFELLKLFFEGQSHKTSFYAGTVSLMGLSLCTMLRSEPQKLQTELATPRQTDRQKDRETDRQAQ